MNDFFQVCIGQLSCSYVDVVALPGSREYRSGDGV